MSKQDIINLTALVQKHLTVFLLIALGLLGKFSYDLLTNKKFTYSYIFGTTGITIFVGYVSAVFITTRWPTQGNLLIPIATMLSFNIVSALVSIDVKLLLKGEIKKAFEPLLRDGKETK
jgi:hypothetical protein